MHMAPLAGSQLDSRLSRKPCAKTTDGTPILKRSGGVWRPASGDTNAHLAVCDRRLLSHGS